jgi:hypothetical protein
VTTTRNIPAGKWCALTNEQRNYIIARVDQIAPLNHIIAEAIEAALELLREDVDCAAAEPEAKALPACCSGENYWRCRNTVCQCACHGAP